MGLPGPGVWNILQGMGQGFPEEGDPRSHTVGEPSGAQEHPWVGRKCASEGLSPLQGIDCRHFYVRSESGLCTW